MPYTQQQINDSWTTHFTHPDLHRDDHFVYMVVTLRAPETRSLLMTMRKQTAGLYDKTQDIDLIKYPERIYELNMISASVVSNTRPFIFMSPPGLIIRCPIENILRVKLCDQHLFAEKPEKLEKLRRSPEPLSLAVQELLADKSHRINEVVVTGMSAAGKTEVIGFIDWPDRISVFQSKSAQMKLPLIRYQWQQGDDDDEMDDDLDMLEMMAALHIPAPSPQKPKPNLIPEAKSSFGGFKFNFLNQATKPKDMPMPTTPTPALVQQAPKQPDSRKPYCGFAPGFLNMKPTKPQEAVTADRTAQTMNKE